MSAQQSNRKFTASELIPGKTYRVTAAFTDYDGIPHPVGETWRFLSENFVPYEDGLTLYVERDGCQVLLRLQWRPEAQADIIDRFFDFAVEL